MNSIIATIVAIVAALASILVLWIVYKILRGLFRRVGQALGLHAQIFGATLSTRLVGLGVVALILPQAISAVVEAPIRFIVSVVHAVLINLTRVLAWPIYDSETRVAWDRILGAMLDVLQKIFWDVAQFINAFFGQLSFPRVVLALALWVVVGQLFDLVFSATPKDQLGTGRLVGFYKGLPLTTRQNILLAAIFLVSAYLSIAAMVAIPWIKEGQAAADISQERQQQLKEVLGTEEKFKQSFGGDYVNKPFAVLSDSLLPQSKNSFALDTLGALKTRWESLVQETKRVRDDYIVQRNQLLTKWQSFRQEAWSRKEKLLQAAISGFENKKRAMGTQEQEFYFQEISNWYRGNLSELDRRLLNAYLFIVARDDGWEAWAESTKNSLQAVLTRLQSADVNVIMQDLAFIQVAGLYSLEGSFIRSVYEDQGMLVLPNPDSLPLPPPPGSQWGIFGLVAGWLLKTRALSLILITGMLGFGLFGAAISSVVREEKARTPGEPLVKDLASVVVRGVSAAVVVFLAVEGGVAIFTTSDPQPNPYVLFFTCLVGAVFSEQVWDWARKRLNQNLAAKELPGQKEEKNEEEPKPETPEETPEADGKPEEKSA